jgi:hypothetical protein
MARHMTAIRQDARMVGRMTPILRDVGHMIA